MPNPTNSRSHASDHASHSRRSVHDAWNPPPTADPTDSDYKIKWADFKKVFKEQFVPEVAVSVVRNEWRALKFNKNQVLKFNQRALELIEILGGSLSITRGDPLWEEYLRKLPHQQKNEKLRYIAFFRSETQILNFLSGCFS